MSRSVKCYNLFKGESEEYIYIGDKDAEMKLQINVQLLSVYRQYQLHLYRTQFVFLWAKIIHINVNFLKPYKVVR